MENGNVLVKWKYFKLQMLSLVLKLLDKAAADRRFTALYSADNSSKLENTKKKEEKATNSQRRQSITVLPPPAPPPEDELCVSSCSTLQDK